MLREYASRSYIINSLYTASSMLCDKKILRILVIRQYVNVENYKWCSIMNVYTYLCCYVMFRSLVTLRRNWLVKYDLLMVFNIFLHILNFNIIFSFMLYTAWIYIEKLRKSNRNIIVFPRNLITQYLLNLMCTRQGRQSILKILHVAPRITTPYAGSRTLYTYLRIFT